MYLFPVRLWDEILAQDIPDLWCGATHVDWWLTRAASLAGCYAAHHGYIDHPSHEESGASKNRTDPYHRHNVKAYNAWARRNGAALDQHRIVLPFIGESMSPVTDYTRWAARWLRGRR